MSQDLQLPDAPPFEGGTMWVFGGRLRGGVCSNEVRTIGVDRLRERVEAERLINDEPSTLTQLLSFWCHPRPNPASQCLPPSQPLPLPPPSFFPLLSPPLPPTLPTRLSRPFVPLSLPRGPSLPGPFPGLAAALLGARRGAMGACGAQQVLRLPTAGRGPPLAPRPLFRQHVPRRQRSA